jgi:probable HAF family extracellular repeat protein
VTDLGSFGGDWAGAKAINNRGVIVGQAARWDGTRHACVWSPRTRRMTTLAGTPAPSTALGINDRGQIVGVYGRRTKHAFLWRPGTHTVVTLPTLTRS